MNRRWVLFITSVVAIALAASEILRRPTDTFVKFGPVAFPSTATTTSDLPHPPTDGPAVRVAVIGGMVDTGFWDAFSRQFEAATRIPVQLVATGQKDTISAVFRNGGIDLITMHASDTIIDLVADGWARDPQPWARNDMILVGPPSDPAGVHGMTDAAEALRKIALAKSKFVVHSSQGAQDIMLSMMNPRGITFDPTVVTMLFDDKQRRVLQVAADQGAYTLLGRIPFETGRIPNSGLVVMVRGDPRLRRPFVVATADPMKLPDAHVPQAIALQMFMRSKAAQDWIGEFGNGKWDELPMFFPVNTRR